MLFLAPVEVVGWALNMLGVTSFVALFVVRSINEARLARLVLVVKGFVASLVALAAEALVLIVVRASFCVCVEIVVFFCLFIESCAFLCHSFISAMEGWLLLIFRGVRRASSVGA